MKVLIITENPRLGSQLDELARSYGADTIIYKWFLKALDNIEEIRPDVIILNANEYPRLWKTLVQFVRSGIGGKDVRIFLYEESPLSDEDQEKYAELGIDGFFGEVSKQSLEVVFSKKGGKEPRKIGQILLSDLPDGRISSGSIDEYSQGLMTCTMDFPAGLREGSVVEATAFIGGKTKDFGGGARIRRILTEENQVQLEIQ